MLFQVISGQYVLGQVMSRCDRLGRIVQVISG
jgi:hypothetical protein